MDADYRGNGKFLSGPVVVRMVACAETGFPLWNKASVTKITTRLLENLCQENQSLVCISQGQGRLGLTPDPRVAGSSPSWLFLACLTLSHQDGSSVWTEWCPGDDVLYSSCKSHFALSHSVFYHPSLRVALVRWGHVTTL